MTLIGALAAKFDRKEFLPSAGDIRHFFEMNNEVAPNVKQRMEAFRQLMKILAAMPLNKLDQLLQENAHGGPARLGPLSEAMRGVGELRAENRWLDAGKSPQEPEQAAVAPRESHGTGRKDGV